MAGSKKRKSKRPTHAKSAPKRGAPKTSLKKSTKPAKKPSSAKKVAAKKKVATPKLQRRPAPTPVPRHSPKAFADKVRDCDAGTAVWFMVAGGIEHAAIQRRGGDGAVVILTDAGVPEVVPSGNLFETADEARAARIR
jgi:hypothetical protein